MQAAARAYEKGWGATPVFTRGGGSIPIVADIDHLMNIPVVMMGYGLDTDGLHGDQRALTASRCSSAASRRRSSTWRSWRNCRAERSRR